MLGNSRIKICEAKMLKYIGSENIKKEMKKEDIWIIPGLG